MKKKFSIWIIILVLLIILAPDYSNLQKFKANKKIISYNIELQQYLLSIQGGKDIKENIKNKLLTKCGNLEGWDCAVFWSIDKIYAQNLSFLTYPEYKILVDKLSNSDLLPKVSDTLNLEKRIESYKKNPNPSERLYILAEGKRITDKQEEYNKINTEKSLNDSLILALFNLELNTEKQLHKYIKILSRSTVQTETIQRGILINFFWGEDKEFYFKWYKEKLSETRYMLPFTLEVLK